MKDYIDLTEILELVLTIISICISTFLLPWLRSKANEQKQKEINNWVKIAVTAAQQLFSSEQTSEKKEYVMNWLNQKGITFDTNKIDAMIEASVYELKQNGVFATTVPLISETSQYSQDENGRWHDSDGKFVKTEVAESALGQKTASDTTMSE